MPLAPRSYDGFLLNLARWVGIETDFLGGLQATDPDWTTTVTGAGAAVAYNSTTDANHPGSVALVCGTTTTGAAAVHCRESIWPAATGQQIFNSLFKMLTTLSNGTDRYTVRAGIVDNAGAIDGTEGIFFRYVDNVNGGRWQCVTRSGGADTNAIDSGVTVATNTHYNLKIVVNAAHTIAQFWINGVLVATASSGVPAAFTTLYASTGIKKSVGTTSITIGNVDAQLYARRVTR